MLTRVLRGKINIEVRAGLALLLDPPSRFDQRSGYNQNAMETFQSQLTRNLSEALAAAGFPKAGEVTPATDPRFGDYQSNVALVLGKQRGENPRKIAETIVANLDVTEISEQPSVAGAGFINFTLKREAVETKIAALIRDERLGVSRISSPKKIVVDFGSPNVAKPMHVGHIRSTFLGDALVRIAQFLGHDVIRDNHIGDWGTQFGMVIWGWKNLLNLEALKGDPIAELVRIYKETNERATKDEAVREAARAELVKLQSGDPENYSIWKQCVDLSMQEFSKAYELLDIHYDIVRGESFYNDRLPAVVDRLLQGGLAEISEGAVCVFFRDIPELADKPCIIRKSDGGYNYATTDLATVDYRINDLKANAIWYVVGAPQILHFKQIFAITRREGYNADFHHVSFGSILGADRKLMKTRSGENVPLRDLLKEGITRARAIIANKNPELAESERNEIAGIIGIGAIKYADLSQYRMTDYIFSWEKMLSLHGNTAPYLQNAYVRIRSIFRKAGATSVSQAPVLGDPAELNLAKRLGQFAEIVPQVLNDFRPNILANYLFELANSFHTFYEACPVLKADEPVRSSRLALCDLTGRVLQRGLKLLGIDVPEKM
ncbi:MAG: arginine--tRNA ligase [Verrucomicrobia bacterium]|nr:MAG: arginine--tRNA ligase [Verrucomicrobiota bacterium]